MSHIAILEAIRIKYAFYLYFDKILYLF